MAGLIWLWQRGSASGGSERKPPAQPIPVYYPPIQPNRAEETMRIVMLAYGYDMANGRR